MRNLRKKGECVLTCGTDGSKCAPLGLDSINNPTRGNNNVKLYILTDADAPYCRIKVLVLKMFHNFQFLQLI